MNTDQIQLLLPRGFKVISADYLHILKNNPQLTGVIVNCCVSTEPGRHWIAIIRQGSAFEIFDSYGLASTGVYGPEITTFALNAKWENRRRVQGWVAETCGFHCLFFIYNRLLRFKSGISVMSKAYPLKVYSCDKLVTAFVKKMTQ